MAKFNNSLLRLALESIATIEKRAFVPPPPPGGAPPMDPAAMGGMPPMDPAMMGGGGMPPMDPAMMGGGGMPPMDPAMMGGAPPADPAMAGADPMAMLAALSEVDPGGGAPAGGGAAPNSDEMRNAIREELTNAGIIKPEKRKPEDMFVELGSKLDAIIKHFNIAVDAPKPPAPVEGAAKPADAAAVMSPGSAGQASSTPLGGGGGKADITTGSTGSKSASSAAKTLRSLIGRLR